VRTAIGVPEVRIAAEVPAGPVPDLTPADAARADIDGVALGSAARALAHRLSPQHVPQLPADMEIEVVTATGVETYHYRLAAGLVELDTVPVPDAVVRVTLQKPVDLVLMENGVSLMTVIASGRASLTGALEDVLGIFGQADYAPRPGRRSFADLSRLLLDCRPARPREVARILDRFGREDFAKELVHFFVEAALLSGVPAELPPATIRFVIGGIAHRCRIGPEGSWVDPDGDDYEATLDVPRMETMIDRLLGRIGDMDAILSRRMLVAGPAVDDLMPLFERISTGLTVFTSAEEQREWTFPSTSAR
jgi:hypothetical protein